MAQGSFIDLCMRERENIVLAHCKFGINIKMSEIEHVIKFKKDINLWMATPCTNRNPIVGK